MVLDAGRLVEYGAPQQLLMRMNGHFRAFVDKSQDTDALYIMAGPQTI